MSLSLCPLTYAEAVLFVDEHHRHRKAPPGHKFAVGVHNGSEVVAAMLVGRPVARAEDDGRTLEINALASNGQRNACSMLLGAARRAAWALGYTRVVTMTLRSESGASLRAAGYKLIGERADRNWNCPGRPRVERNTGPKFKWECSTNRTPARAGGEDGE